MSFNLLMYQEKIAQFIKAGHLKISGVLSLKGLVVKLEILCVCNVVAAQGLCSPMESNCNT